MGESVESGPSSERGRGRGASQGRLGRPCLRKNSLQRSLTQRAFGRKKENALGMALVRGISEEAATRPRWL